VEVSFGIEVWVASIILEPVLFANPALIIDPLKFIYVGCLAY